jgi:hypothetical protein
MLLYGNYMKGTGLKWRHLPFWYTLFGFDLQLIKYASKLLNLVQRNYTTNESETLTMVYALHKFKH